MKTITIAKFDENTFGCIDGTVRSDEICKDWIMEIKHVKIPLETHTLVMSTKDWLSRVLRDLFHM